MVAFSGGTGGHPVFRASSLPPVGLRFLLTHSSSSAAIHPAVVRCLYLLLLLLSPSRTDRRCFLVPTGMHDCRLRGGREEGKEESEGEGAARVRACQCGKRRRCHHFVLPLAVARQPRRCSPWGVHLRWSQSLSYRKNHTSQAFSLSPGEVIIVYCRSFILEIMSCDYRPNSAPPSLPPPSAAPRLRGYTRRASGGPSAHNHLSCRLITFSCARVRC